MADGSQVPVRSVRVGLLEDEGVVAPRLGDSKPKLEPRPCEPCCGTTRAAFTSITNTIKDSYFGMPKTDRVKEYHDRVLAGNANAMILGINEIHKVELGDLVFVDHPKYYDTCLKSAADFIIINTKEVNIPEGKTILVVFER